MTISLDSFPIKVNRLWNPTVDSKMENCINYSNEFRLTIRINDNSLTCKQLYSILKMKYLIWNYA